LTWCVDILREILNENRLKARVAVISAEIDKETVLESYLKNEIEPLDFVPELKKDDITGSTRIVAQMGMGPIMESLEKGAEIIIAGRCYDPAVFAAVPVSKGYEAGLALHMGKILECASIASDPGSGSDCMMGVISEGGFKVFPLNDDRKCTVMSVAAHTLYEKSNPYMLHGPDGIIDLNKCSFSQLDDRTVGVTGTAFIFSEKPMIKLEGARKTGYRTISIAGVRDPVMIDGLDDIMEYVRETVAKQFKRIEAEYTLAFRIYGRDGVMGCNEPSKFVSHEVGIIIEAVANTQDEANSICSFARSTMLHYGYPGRISTAGNLAFPYSPSDIKTGEVYEFCIYHLMPLKDRMFEIEWMEV
ncbi:MAG: acyclic terpene utilization AtuA family protein, partial [Clostridia bacterium]|nr:acyclic terpene utilization AtuA family protein [Clostridia bacterium]